jgi:hypothetical protein
MAKSPSLTNISSGFASNTQLNDNFAKLVEAFNNTLSLDGSTPNAMKADLDLNGYNLINVGGVLINGADLLSLINNVTVSTLGPSGGSDGDVWFTVNT